MKNPSLMNVFEFSAADLNANRNGHITDSQRRKLQRRQLESSILPIILVVAAAAILQVTIRDFARTMPSNEYVLRIVGAGAFLLVSIVFFGIRWLRISTDLSTGHVRTISGRIMLGAMETRNLGYYGSGFRLKIQEIDFIVPWAVRKALTEGKRYKLYYTPKARIILSIERI